MVYTVDMVYTVNIVLAVDMVYTVDIGEDEDEEEMNEILDFSEGESHEPPELLHFMNYTMREDPSLLG